VKKFQEPGGAVFLTLWRGLLFAHFRIGGLPRGGSQGAYVSTIPAVMQPKPDANRHRLSTLRLGAASSRLRRPMTLVPVAGAASEDSGYWGAIRALVDQEVLLRSRQLAIVTRRSTDGRRRLASSLDGVSVRRLSF
jgi:hypothetical protein